MTPTLHIAVDARAHRRFLLALLLLTLFAWLLREYFVLATVVEAPIRGDVRDYVAYAWNLVHHGVFSKAWPTDTAAVPVPDGFRPYALGQRRHRGGTEPIRHRHTEDSSRVLAGIVPDLLGG